MPAQKKYTVETWARAVRMFADRMTEGGLSQLAARREVGELLGIKQETLRNWIRRDLGEGSTLAASENSNDELVRLRKENAQLRRANDILKTASVNSTGQRNSASSLSAGVALPEGRRVPCLGLR